MVVFITTDFIGNIALWKVNVFSIGKGLYESILILTKL